MTKTELLSSRRESFLFLGGLEYHHARGFDMMDPQKGILFTLTWLGLWRIVPVIMSEPVIRP